MSVAALRQPEWKRNERNARIPAHVESSPRLLPKGLSKQTVLASTVDTAIDSVASCCMCARCEL